jgi:excisionase family DNA binding protein
MLYNIRQVARMLNIAETTARRWASEGKLPGLKLGRSFKFTEEQLQQFFDDNPAAAGLREKELE